MAVYGFAPSGYGLTGGGSLYGNLGYSLMGGLNAGFGLENQFRNLQNRNITDQFTVPAAAAGADAARLNYANQALLGAASAAELTNLASLSSDPQVRSMQEQYRQLYGYYPNQQQLSDYFSQQGGGQVGVQPLGPAFSPQ